MMHSFPEFTIGGVFIAPFVIYAGAAMVAPQVSGQITEIHVAGQAGAGGAPSAPHGDDSWCRRTAK
jgi:hypothetical protein